MTITVCCISDIDCVVVPYLILTLLSPHVQRHNACHKVIISDRLPYATKGSKWQHTNGLLMFLNLL